MTYFPTSKPDDLQNRAVGAENARNTHRTRAQTVLMPPNLAQNTPADRARGLRRFSARRALILRRLRVIFWRSKPRRRRRKRAKNAPNARADRADAAKSRAKHAGQSCARVAPVFCASRVDFAPVARHFLAFKTAPSAPKTRKRRTERARRPC